MPILPVPGGCVACGSGGGGTPGVDVEDLVLCDVDPTTGEVLGSAVAVYIYDDATGAPVGAPTFVIPGTNTPYVPAGILQPCPAGASCGAPQRFCFVSTATVDNPGRMYDLTLTLGLGFAVTGILKDLTKAPVNILWNLADPAGTQFATDLQAAIGSQFAGSTVTVTPTGTDPCGGTGDFAIHIECLRIDQTPPTLVQLEYNGGRDLIQNAAFDSVPSVDFFGFLDRQDTAFPTANADVNCTNVANRGWETNDKSGVFEMWGNPSTPGSQAQGTGTTPTPRGTRVQEINAFGSGATPVAGTFAGNPAFGQNPDTIWQTFVVPAAGNFTVKVVVGGRGQTNNIPVKLSTGDVGDAGIGDVINTVVVAPSVNTEAPAGFANGWTTFTQTVPLAPGTYTLAFTGPNTPVDGVPGGANSFGGLFTDMRVFQDAPGTLANFVNDDDTCTVPSNEVETTCAFFTPGCSNGDIVGWTNTATGEQFTNAAFWAQVPAPQCCETVPGGTADSGGTTTNLIHTYLVCGVTDTGTRTLSRVVITDPNGAAISEQFVDTNGALVTPSSWQPGQCEGSSDLAIFAGFVCDAFGGSPAEPATLATCPGQPLAAPANPFVGAGLTEGPAGTFTPTGALNATYIWRGDPNDAQHGLCSVKFVNDPGTGDDPLWALFGDMTQQDGNQTGLDGNWINAILTALGTTELTDIPPGSTASAVTGGTTVTITFDGPSTHSQMWAGNSVFFVREQDGDGLAAGVTLEFDPPVRDFRISPNITVPTPGSISGLQESQATPGTYAVPAAPASVTTVKQFRTAGGATFYENLDGTPHAVTGTIGDCGEYFQEFLCDATDKRFIRLYHLVGGTIASSQDYALDGTTTATVDPVGTCDVELTTFRHTPAEILCHTDANTNTVTQFLRRYLINQDGISVIAVIDTLLDGTTLFNVGVGNTIALCSATTGDTTGCTTASSVGTICYTPPFSAASPAVFMSDDWTGSTVTGANAGPQTIVNSNFAGLGRVVTMSLNKGAGLLANAILLGNAPTVANALYSLHLDTGGSVTGLSMTFNSFGTLGNEILRNFSVPFDTIVGAGSAVAGNTGVNPTASNGTVTLTWNGPLSGLDFEWRSQAGGTLSTISTVSFTTVAVAGSDQTIGTAAVLLDCVTGAITYRDLVTGTVFDPADVTIVDCTSGATPIVLGEVCYNTPVAGPNFRGGLGSTGSSSVVANPLSITYLNYLGSGVDVMVTSTGGGGFVSGTTTQLNPNGTQPVTISFSQPVALNSITVGELDAGNTEFVGGFDHPVVGVTGFIVAGGAPGEYTSTVNNGNPDGDIQFGGVNTTSLNYHVRSVGLGQWLQGVDFNTLVAGDVGRLAVVRCEGCSDNAITYVDLETGLSVTNPDFIDCPGDAYTGPSAQDIADAISATPPVAVTLRAEHKNVVPGTPWNGVDVTGFLTSVTYTVVSGTATVTDENGGVVSAVPAGFTQTWNAQDENFLLGPQSIVADAASRVIVSWTERS